MPKLKKDKGDPLEFLKEIDKKIESGKLTDEEVKVLNDLKQLIEAGIENGDFDKKKITFNVVMLNILKYIIHFSVSFLFILVMYGLTFNFITNNQFYPILFSGLIIAFSHVITGSVDYLRFFYDKLYFGIKISLIAIRFIALLIVNMYFYRMYDPTIMLIIAVVVSDFCSSYVLKKIFK